MQYDAGVTTSEGQILETDICIVGAGAAGLAMAHSFINATFAKSGKKINVIVLESSSRNIRQPYPYKDDHRYMDPTVQPLYGGEMTSSIATAYEFFLGSRIRCYGGTTNCWGGWTQPLTDFDFNRNTSAATSLVTWPIKPGDLRPYYQRAMGYCSVGTWNFDAYANPALWKDEADVDVLALNDTPPRLQSRAILTMGGNDADNDDEDNVIDGAWDFQHLWGQSVRIDPTVAVYRNANVRYLESKDKGKSVDRLKVSTLTQGGQKEGHSFYVRARRYVLAASCIENTRLLLHSGEIAGVAGAALGKYLMTHPLILEAATFKMNKAVDGKVTSFYGPGVQINRTSFKPTVFAVLVPTPNLAFYNAALGNFRAWVGLSSEIGREGGVNLNWEQFPDASNRIELSKTGKMPVFDKDPVAKATMDLTKTDKDTMAFALKMVGQVLQDPKNAYVKDYKLVPNPKIILTGQHAMGTTRMSADPSRGVVNADCRMHNVSNLYVAGGSVFPSAGWANPTLTIIALAVRLSDHLRSLD